MMTFPTKITVAVVLCVAFCASTTSGLSVQKNANASSKSDTAVGRRAFVEGGMAAVASVGVAAITASPPAVAAETGAGSLPLQGTKPPEFELPNSRGNGMTSLDGLVKNGKWTVLYFYPGAFTSGCTLEARGFQRDYDDFRKLNAQIVGVSVDPVEKNAQFCSEEKLDFFMLSDKGGVVSKKYGSSLSVPGFGTFSNRQTYIIDPKGELRWIFTDVESRISRHSAEVLEKLTELETAKA